MVKRQASLPSVNQKWFWVSRHHLVQINKQGPIRRMDGILEKYVTGRYYLDNHSIAFDTEKDAEVFKIMYNLMQ